MEEPNRIGLTSEVNNKLEELLEHINGDNNEETGTLYKKDLYRLALAIGIKKGKNPEPLSQTSVGRLRVVEIDPDGVIKAAAKTSMDIPKDLPVYNFLECLAEMQISEMCAHYQMYGELSIESFFEDI